MALRGSRIPVLEGPFVCHAGNIYFDVALKRVRNVVIAGGCGMAALQCLEQIK